VQKRSPGGSTTKFMGQMIKEKYGDQYYSMGLFVTKGNTYQHWTGDTIAFDNSDHTFLESKMMSNQGYRFLNLLDEETVDANNWLKKNLKALEIENGGEVNFIPVERFDGILNINESDVPTFD